MERETPDGFASLAPILLPVSLPQAKWKAKEGAKKKAKADAALRAKKTESKPRILYIPHQKVKVGNESQRASQETLHRTRNNIGRDHFYWNVIYLISRE